MRICSCGFETLLIVILVNCIGVSWVINLLMQPPVDEIHFVDAKKSIDYREKQIMFSTGSRLPCAEISS